MDQGMDQKLCLVPFFAVKSLLTVSAPDAMGLTINRAGGFLTAFGGSLKASDASSGA
jgi:hypothetical protein